MLPIFKSLWQNPVTKRRRRCILLLFSAIIFVVVVWQFMNYLRSPSYICELPIADNETITALSFLPHSRVLLSGSMKGNLEAWDISNKSRSHLFKSRSPMRISAHPNGDCYAARWLGDRVACRSFSRQSEMRVYTESPGLIETISFSPSGKLLAAGGLDALVMVWESSSGRLIATLQGHSHSITALAFFDDHLLATAAAVGENIRIWDLDRNELKRELESPLKEVAALFFVDQSTLIALGSGFPNADNSILGVICFWDLFDVTSKETITVDNSIFSAVLTPDKTQFFAGCSYGQLLIGNIRERRITHRFRAHKWNISALSISSDGQLLASSSDDRRRSSVIRIWDVATLCSMGHY